MLGISGINGSNGGYTSGNQEQVTIDGVTITLSGDPDKDAETAAEQLGCTKEIAAQKLKAVKGEPQQPSSCGKGSIGSMLSGETKW